MANSAKALTLIAATLAWAQPSSAVAGWFFGPNGYHECILDRLTGATDDNAATEGVIGCRNEFSPMAPEERLHPLFFGPKTIKECLESKLAETSSPFAVAQIQEACISLYPDSGESTVPPQ